MRLLIMFDLPVETSKERRERIISKQKNLGENIVNFVND